LADVLDAEHRAIAPSQTKIVGKMTFGDALAISNKFHQTHTLALAIHVWRQPHRKFSSKTATFHQLRSAKRELWFWISITHRRGECLHLHGLRTVTVSAVTTK
jgi:hypothetical protein